MPATPFVKDREYLLAHCAKYLARDNTDERHNFLGTAPGQPRAAISESWRFPVIDSHDADEPDAYEWNDVTFVYAIRRAAETPAEVLLVTTVSRLWEPVSLARLEDHHYWTVTLKVRKAQQHRYRFVVDGKAILDPINPQTVTLATGEVWSRFFSWAYNQPITFERWEQAIVDRLARHVLPFNNREAQNFLKRGANESNVPHLYRLDVSVGVSNYIDKALAREERHRLYAYKTCLQMLDTILRRRHPGKDPEFMEESAYVRIYHEMADSSPVLFADGWDLSRYENPSHFLYLLRRHAITGAFTHPKYGGNAGGMAWAYLSEQFQTDTGATAFDWRQAIEPPLGASPEYRG